MPELFTCSYYAWKPELGAGVRVTLSAPRWGMDVRSWPYVWELTPRWWYWKRDDLPERFAEQLDRYGIDRIRKALDEAATQTGSDRLVLCCFERGITATDECHRRMFARWWHRQTGELIPELDPHSHVPLIERWLTDRITHTGPGQYEITSVEQPTEEE